MPYCAQQDIENDITQKTVLQLTDDTGAGSVNATYVDKAITEADAVIDSYCGSRYAVPFASVPERIKQLSIDIAIYHLFARRGKVPELRETIYNNAVSFLKDVARGTATLGKQPAPAATPEGGAKFTGPDRVFDREKLRDF